MKSNKAADKMGIIFEMIKFGTDELHHHILKILNLILMKGQVPEEWSTIFFSLIPKSGDLTKVENWRPIAVLKIMYKIFCENGTQSTQEESEYEIIHGSERVSFWIWN